VFIESLFKDPVRWATTVFVVIASVVLHELGHAVAATWEGDPTPRNRGHLTWNPVVHMGWLSLGLTAVIGIAWGLTPVTPAYFRHRRWGEVIVAAAGPAVNLVLAVASALVLALVEHQAPRGALAGFWETALVLNVALFLLNVIPVPPLDGFTVAQGTFDLGELAHWLRRMRPWPLLVVLLLITRGPFWDVTYHVAGVFLGFFAGLLRGAA